MDNAVAEIYPDKAEKKYIRSRYAKTGLAILVDFVIFQVVSLACLYAVGAFSGASGSIDDVLTAGQEVIGGNDFASVFFSIGFPIAAEIIAIIMGVKMLGIDLKSKFTRDGYNLGEIAGGTTLGFFAQTAAVIIIMVLYLLFSGSTEAAADNVIVQKSSLGANIILYTYVCIAGPIIEEVLFRGIVLESVKMYNERFAIVFSAFIFGLMHGNITQAVNGFLAGLILGTLYVRSGSLVPSSVMHILMNTVTSLMSVMMYSDPNIAENLINDPMSALTGLPLVGIAINLVIRVVSFPAGIALLAVTASKGFGLRKANPAGKKRAAPLVFTTPTWIAVIILYIAVIIRNF